MKAKTKDTSYLHWVFPAMVAFAGLEILLSGRDLTQAFAQLQADVDSIVEPVRSPVLAWIQRGVSVLLLIATTHHVVSHLRQRKPIPSPLLLTAFLVYWFTNVALPGLFGAVPRVSHEYLYPVFLGTAMALCGPAERDRVMNALRNSFILFMGVSVLLIAVMPAMVLDSSYSQGLLPGVPRFGGLASHPVGMGMLAATALLVLWAHPFERRWLSAAAWLLGLGVLFIAQSKTAWVAFLVGATCMVAVRQLPDSMARMSDPRQNSFGVVLCLAVIGLVLLMLASFLVADLPGVIAGFFDSAQGAQLMSMTGRDRIWIVAMDEWQHNPVFGYGLTIWDSAYRQAIGMPFATHAHNQLMDSLSRSGSIGAIGLIFYALVLMVLAFRHARSSGGLSVALFTVLALLSISEVPLMLIGYGLDVLPHMMLLTSIAAGAAARRPRPTVVSPITASFRTTRSA